MFYYVNIRDLHDLSGVCSTPFCRNTNCRHISSLFQDSWRRLVRMNNVDYRSGCIRWKTMSKIQQCLLLRRYTCHANITSFYICSFCYFMQSRTLILYRCLGTNYQSHSRVKGYCLQGSSSPMFFLDRWTLEDVTDRLPRNVGT